MIDSPERASARTIPADERVPSPTPRRVAGSDWTFVWIFGLVLFVVSSLPYLYGYWFTPADKEFMGLTYTVHDYSQYMSWARESADKILVPNKLTPEVNQPAFFDLLWFVVGRIDHYTGLSFIQTNQLLRLVAAALFLAMTYKFCARALVDRVQRRFALVLSCLMAGVGWVIIALKPFTHTLFNPTLIYNTPGNTFFGIMVVPHQILSAAWIVGIFLVVLDAYRKSSVKLLALAGGLTLFLGLEHAYDQVTVYAVVAAFAVLVTVRDGWRRQWIVGLALFYAISAPAPLFWLSLERGNAQWREVLQQYQNLGVFTPDPVQLIALLGIVFVVAALTFRGFVPLASKSDLDLFLGAWFVVGLVLIYLPTQFQIMNLNGFQVALAVMATQGLFGHIVPWIDEQIGAVRWPMHLERRRVSALFLAGFLAFAMATNVYLLGQRFVDMHRHNYPEFLYRDDVAALDWIAARARPDDVVLSSFDIGHWLPGWTGAHAFIAHGSDTLGFTTKRALVAQFYGPTTSDAEREQLLRQYKVNYVFDGPAERQLGDYDPAKSSYLTLVFSSPHTRVYQVMEGQLALAP